MKTIMRKIARRISRLPVVGRAVHILAAIWRLPQIRLHTSMLAQEQTINGASFKEQLSRFDTMQQQLTHLDGMRQQQQPRLDTMQEQLTHLDAVREQQQPRLDTMQQQLTNLDAMHSIVEVSYREQLPALLDAISKLNARQHRVDQDQQNLIVSVPVALRHLQQNFGRLEESHAASLLEIKTQAVDFNAAHTASIEAISAEAKDMHSTVQGQRSQIDGLSGQVGLNVVQSGEQSVRLDDFQASSSYLVGRVEFVRRELMFEMRYGRSSPEQAADPLETAARVVNEDKLASARQTGVRLNLGCGHIALDAFINVDRRELPGVDVVAEVNALPEEVRDVDEVFSAHLLEHFPQEQLRRELLPYWKSLLREGGVFRAVVPDAEAMIREYTAGSYPYDDLREVIYGGQDYDGDFHFNMFTPEHMTRLLEEAGFESVKLIEAGRKNGKCFEFEIIATKSE